MTVLLNRSKRALMTRGPTVSMVSTFEPVLVAAAIGKTLGCDRQAGLVLAGRGDRVAAVGQTVAGDAPRPVAERPRSGRSGSATRRRSAWRTA